MKQYTLTLALEKKWFDMIKAGIKKEEYREIKDYWLNRFGSATKQVDCKAQTEKILYFYPTIIYDKIVFTLGYPKKDDASRHLVFKNPRFRIGEGRPEWGAEPGKKYFVITWDAE